MFGVFCRQYLNPNTLLATSRRPLSPRSSIVDGLGRISTTVGRMESSRGDDGERSKNPNSKPDVAKIQSILSENPEGGWDKCWKESVTPWDYGQPTPIVVHLLKMGSLPIGRVLVPGCGSGHDVVAIAGPERYVVGLDISQTAVKKAQELSSQLPNANCFAFLVADFFTWRPTELFDLIFDYTFFCAIDPCMRSAWASQIYSLLKPDGELITLIYPISDYIGGPPYAVSVADYEKVLNPLGFKVIYIEDNELAIETRKGREKIARWRRNLGESHM